MNMDYLRRNHIGIELRRGTDMVSKMYPVMARPGVQRDGSQYASNNYIDAQWVRFQRGLPRKIGGYKQLLTNDKIVRGMYVQPINTNVNVYLGDELSVKYFSLDQLGNVTGGPTDRTPATYVPNANNQWTFDTLFVTNATFPAKNCILAHAAPNALDITSNVETEVFYGDINSNAALVPTGITCSGGFVSLHPYVMYYGTNGIIKISNPGDPTTILLEQPVTGQDIIQGKQVRGGNSSPAGLFWSLDSVIRVTQAGTNSTVAFRYDTLTDESSIMASNSVIEYDSRYFWIGVDKFFIYNGVVQELPNDQSTNYFFDNVNITYREKIWATKVPHYNEIWWFYPHGNSTECNEALIFNVKTGTWYDTSIERSSGYYPQVFNKPIWTDNVADENGQYPIWLHETGYDKVVNNTYTAIRAYYETSLISYASQAPDGQWSGTDRWTNLICMEPDFATLVGDMTLTVNGREYMQGALNPSSPYTFNANTNKVDMNGSGEQRRFMTLIFESNTIGGNFQAGQILLEIGIGDARK